MVLLKGLNVTKRKEKVFTTLDDLPEIDFENEGPQYPEGGSA